MHAVENLITHHLLPDPWIIRSSCSLFLLSAVRYADVGLRYYCCWYS